ncbi:MAG: hypothetical protein ABI702_07050 [Burkholderiales bacterium]
MSATTSPATRIALLLMHAGLLLAAGAQAQTPACEQFKGVLAARMRLDAERFTLEAVPASTALPAGTRIAGTCGGGAYKIVQVRKGETVPEASAAVRPAAASAPAPASRPAPTAASRPATPAVPAPVVVASAVPVVVAVPVVKPASPEPADLPAAALSTPTLPGSDFITEYGRWLWLLVALPLAAWGWRWFTHGRFYDRNGLPRGPKF